MNCTDALHNFLILHTESTLGWIRLQVTTFTANFAILASLNELSTALVITRKCGEIWLEPLALLAWTWGWSRCWSRCRGWCRGRHRPICDDHIGTAEPNLVCLLAIPPPAKNILARLVWHIDLIHHAENVRS